MSIEKELRLGNLVNCQKNDGSGLMIVQVQVLSASYKIGGIGKAVGIPLTEDWLLKFGFERPQFAYNFNEPDWRIFKISGGFCVGEKDGKFAWYNEADDDYHSKYYPIFLHVHHLQNFYYAYTQKELEIKNPSPTEANEG